MSGEQSDGVRGPLAPARSGAEPRDFLARLYAWRDRTLSDPGFQRWATSFPLTRFVARRRARALFDVAAGFVYAQVLAACVQFDLFAKLRDGPRTAGELAPALGLSGPAAERLLLAAAALRLTETRASGRYGLGTLGAALLGNDGVRAMIAHHGLLYADLADPVGLLQREGGGTLASYWAYAKAASPAELGADKVAEYSALMAASNGMVADQVLGAYSVRQHRRLLDVGGGEGAFLIAAAARAPALQLMLFDLPAVVDLARERLRQAGVLDRATLAGGDFFRDPWPAGADLISLVRVLHDHDDAAAMALLRAARVAIQPGGTLLIAEPMAGGGEAAIGDAYFGFYLLAMGSGRARTPETLSAMLLEAGFSQPRLVRNAAPMLARVLVARG